MRNFQDLVEIALQVYMILSSDGFTLDMSTRSYAPPSANAGLGSTVKLPTLSQCMDQFPASCLESVSEILPELVDIPPGRIVLSHHCAMDIYRRVFGSGTQSTAAFHVEIKNCSNEVRVFAGMAEVSALQEPVVWILDQRNWLIKLQSILDFLMRVQGNPIETALPLVELRTWKLAGAHRAFAVLHDATALPGRWRSGAHPCGNSSALWLRLLAASKPGVL